MKLIKTKEATPSTITELEKRKIELTEYLNDEPTDEELIAYGQFMWDRDKEEAKAVLENIDDNLIKQAKLRKQVVVK